MKRAKRHRSQVLRGEKTHKANWIRQLEKLGLGYGIVVLEKTLLPSDLEDAERRWIAELRAGGAKLTNMTDGGDGTPGRAYTVSEETRQKIREANLGSKLTPEQRKRQLAAAEKRRGTRLSAAHRQKISERMKGNTIGCGRISSPETRKKLSELAYKRYKNGEHPAKGLKRSEETKVKMSLARKGKKCSAEARAKMSAAQRRRWQRERETRAGNG